MWFEGGGYMKGVVLGVMLCGVVIPASADAQTRYFAREKIIRAQDVVQTPAPNPTPTPAVGGCGTTMKREIWGVDGDGYTTLTTRATSVDNAFTFCEAKFKQSGPGVCGYWTNGTVYYWKSIRTENRNNSALMGTICQ
jgi:hypothetical protein